MKRLSLFLLVFAANIPSTHHLSHHIIDPILWALAAVVALEIICDAINARND